MYLSATLFLGIVRVRSPKEKLQSSLCVFQYCRSQPARLQSVSNKLVSYLFQFKQLIPLKVFSVYVWSFFTESFFKYVGTSPQNKPYFPDIKINGSWFMTSAYINVRIYKKPLCMCLHTKATAFLGCWCYCRDLESCGIVKLHCWELRTVLKLWML